MCFCLYVWMKDEQKRLHWYIRIIKTIRFTNCVPMPAVAVRGHLKKKRGKCFLFATFPVSMSTWARRCERLKWVTHHGHPGITVLQERGHVDNSAFKLHCSMNILDTSKDIWHVFDLNLHRDDLNKCNLARRVAEASKRLECYVVVSPLDPQHHLVAAQHPWILRSMLSPRS